MDGARPQLAADADLWIAYALSEAARLWHTASYAHLAQAMADLIVREEVAWIPQLGATLLPGPKGFVSQQTFRLNASYSPMQVLRLIGKQSGNPLWVEVLQSSVRVIIGSAPHGYAADWIDYRPADGFVSDPATNGVGSYNAIRVYLGRGCWQRATRKPLCSRAGSNRWQPARRSSRRLSRSTAIPSRCAARRRRAFSRLSYPC